MMYFSSLAPFDLILFWVVYWASCIILSKSLIYAQVPRGRLPNWAGLGSLSAELLIKGSSTRRGRSTQDVMVTYKY